MAAARAMLPPSNWMMRLGRTGAMMPKARKSKRTVTRMKMKAAWLRWGRGVGGAAEDKVSSKGMGDCSGEWERTRQKNRCRGGAGKDSRSKTRGSRVGGG